MYIRMYLGGQSICTTKLTLASNYPVVFLNNCRKMNESYNPNLINHLIYWFQ